MFYFRTTPFYTAELQAISQFRKVAEFRKKLEKLGVLYWTYSTPLEFERNVREHLIRRLMQFSDSEPRTSRSRVVPVGRHVISRPSDIFLGYGFEDREDAQVIYQELRIAGYEVWMDAHNLIPGQMLHRELEDAIRNSTVILLLLSSKSRFDQGWALKEVGIAQRLWRKKGKAPILAVRLDNVAPPAVLAGLRWIEYSAPDGWRGFFRPSGR